MKLYEAPRNCRIRIVSETKVPPFSAGPLSPGDELEFFHVDGMYSLCKTASGAWCHPHATTDVEIILDKN